MFGYITTCFMSVASGLAIYFTLVLIKQRWVRTLHHLITYLLLPPIAFVITNIISNNFALSLGMIGALSIIRFRNPVKNPLELVIFFALLTSGISFAVNYKWGIFLVFIVVSVLLACKALEKAFKNKLFDFSMSFDDDDFANIIEVESKSAIDFLENSESLILFNHIREPEETYFYKLSIKDQSHLTDMKEKLKSYKDIKNLEIKLLDHKVKQ